MKWCQARAKCYHIMYWAFPHPDTCYISINNIHMLALSLRFNNISDLHILLTVRYELNIRKKSTYGPKTKGGPTNGHKILEAYATYPNINNS